MKTDTVALITSALFFFAGLCAARAQQGWGPGYYCDGPYLPCTSYACNPESGTCTSDEGQQVNFTNYMQSLVAYYYTCGPMNNANCPQPWSINTCAVTFYQLPPGETTCLDQYEVCNGYITFKTCGT